MQGAEMKLRQIGDFLEAQLNQGFTWTSYLKLQGVGYIAGLALKVARAVAEGKQKHGSGQWGGTCSDLAKPTNKLAFCTTAATSRSFATRTLKATPSFFVANSLMFGATAAVCAFSRISRSLWYPFQ